jgi:hypothetical protein
VITYLSSFTCRIILGITHFYLSLYTLYSLSLTIYTVPLYTMCALLSRTSFACDNDEKNNGISLYLYIYTSIHLYIYTSIHLYICESSIHLSIHQFSLSLSSLSILYSLSLTIYISMQCVGRKHSLSSLELRMHVTVTRKTTASLYIYTSIQSIHQYVYTTTPPNFNLNLTVV